MECDGNWDPPMISLPKSWRGRILSCRHGFRSFLSMDINKKCRQHPCRHLVLCHWCAYDIDGLFQTEVPAAINCNQKLCRIPEVFISIAMSCDSTGNDHEPCNHTHSAHSQSPRCTSSPVLLKALASSGRFGHLVEMKVSLHSKFQ